MADSNKTEQATPRHRQKARERGQVTRSRELTSALSMFAVAGVSVPHRPSRQPHHWTDFFRNTLELASIGHRSSRTARCSSGPASKRCAGLFPFWLAALVVSLACGSGAGRLCLRAGSAGVQVRAPQPGDAPASSLFLPPGSARFSNLFCRSPRSPGSA